MFDVEDATDEERLLVDATDPTLLWLSGRCQASQLSEEFRRRLITREMTGL